MAENATMAKPKAATRKAAKAQATQSKGKTTQAKRTRKRDPLDRVREFCLSLPETSEKLAWGAPTFRVNDKLFCHYRLNHHGDGRTAIWCKAPPGAQELLIESDPERFFKPPYVGPSGWIGVRLDRPGAWSEVEELLEESYRMTAPKKVLALLDEG